MLQLSGASDIKRRAGLSSPRRGAQALILLLTVTLVLLPASNAVSSGLRRGGTGPNNSITDVPGILVGHSTFTDRATGTTVLLMPGGAVGGSSPSGGAPGDRETEILTGDYQDTMRTRIHGIMLNGGSIFGLDAACGLRRFIEEEYGVAAPRVPGAIIYDLARGGDYDPTNANAEPKPNDCNTAYDAAKRATSGAIKQGSVGAGTGAMSGGVKGGIGTASTYLGDGIYIGAIVTVNSAGRTYNSATNCELFTAYLEKDNEYGGLGPPPDGCGTSPFSTAEYEPYRHTTIGTVATNFPLTGGQVQKLAIAANDGMARAIHTSRSPLDGDTIFAVSTGKGVPPLWGATYADAKVFQRLLAESADTWARAVNHAILNAKGIGIGTPYCEQYPGACSDPQGQQQDPSRQTASQVTGEGPNGFSERSQGGPPGTGPAVVLLPLLLLMLLLALPLQGHVKRWIAPWLDEAVKRLPAHSARRRLSTILLASALVSATISVATFVVPDQALSQGAPGGTGPLNNITDVPGVIVGNATLPGSATGTTVLEMVGGSVAGSSTTGGGATNRVTEILKAEFQDSMRTDIYGILLNGGSVYGLDAACGLIRHLQENERGIVFGTSVVPIVPGASIDDLGRGKDYDPKRPLEEKKPNDCDIAYEAATTALPGPFDQGTVGAGTGAVSGGITGGLGTASSNLGEGIFIGALVIVNSYGKPYNYATDCGLFSMWLERNDEYAGVQAPPGGCEGDRPAPRARKGDHFGTIGVVATNLPLTGGQVERMAGIINDGLARAIRPSHTPFDGDTIYALSTGKAAPAQPGATFADAVPLLLFYGEAMDVYSRAINHAILNADASGIGQTYCERFSGACPNQSEQDRATREETSEVPSGGSTGAIGGSGFGPSSGALAVLLFLAYSLVVRPHPMTREKRGSRTRVIPQVY